MGYPKVIFDKADAVMAQRRTKAKSELIKRREEIYTSIPKVQQLENEIASLPMHAVRSIIAGKYDREELENCKKKSLELQKKLDALLESHGYESIALEEQYQCENCNDTGYVDGIMCPCMRSLLKELACDYLNSTSSLKLCSFDDFKLEYYSDLMGSDGKISPRKKMSRIFEYCVNYARDFTANSKNILMQGATGLGKTHLSLSIALEVTQKGYGVIYCSAPNITRQLEKDYFNKDGNRDETESTLIESDLLIIDDLGTEYANKYSLSALYNVINTRLNMNKPTIISTNFSASELQQIYGMRFVSRVIGEFDRLDFVGSDIRQIKLRNK